MRSKRLFPGLLALLLSTAVAGNIVSRVSAVDSKHSRKHVSDNTAAQAEAGSPAVSQLAGKLKPRSRTFRFHYKANVDALPVGARVRVWIPLPQANDHQNVELLAQDLPVAGSIATEPTYGNRILYCETNNPSAARLAFSVSFLIRRQEVRGFDENHGPTMLTDKQRQRFLSANTRVPLKGRQLDLLGGLRFTGDSLAVARTLYDRVDDHVRYDKSNPGYGNGDVLWVCDSRFGNCTDFHSLFISWARAKNIPARFEIGFPLPPGPGKGMIGGYHCWALFHDDNKGWVPVDISEADKHPEMKEYYFGNLSENRVVFTTGRDIVLAPPQDGSPLNFFVYPYIEVDGKPWPKDNVRLSFSYEDVVDAPAE
ncbi:MAG TPA: transglutaminase domain-containing protein [Planctomycetes bacterium]|nr:transglutaminase domain-containing protein [Planctomycetota bacterium]